MPSVRDGVARSEPLHHQVARNLRNSISAGTLRDGDVLPSSRELADRWGVSVFTISEAMKMLAQEGLITSKSRSKRVVRAPGQAMPLEPRPRDPRVILIGGYAGSGKTELGRILTRQTGWPMLDKDTFTRPVVEVALEALGRSPHDRESDIYLNQIRPREYEALRAATIENVECGNSAVVTAPFFREFGDAAWLSRTQALFAELRATITLVWVYCDAETMYSYIRHRGAARDAAKMADWSTYLNGLNLDFRPSVPHMVIQNCASSTPLQPQAATLLQTVLAGNDD